MARTGPLLPWCRRELRQSLFFSDPRNQEFFSNHCLPCKLVLRNFSHQTSMLPCPPAHPHSCSSQPPTSPPKATTRPLPDSPGFPFPWNLSNRGSPLPWTPVKVSSARPPPEVGSPRGIPLTMWPAPSPQHPSLSLAYGPRSLDSVPGREVEALVPRPACLYGCPAPAAPGLPPHTDTTGRQLGPGISTVQHTCPVNRSCAQNSCRLYSLPSSSCIIPKANYSKNFCPPLSPILLHGPFTQDSEYWL